jgi:hypothetical protein
MPKQWQSQSTLLKERKSKEHGCGKYRKGQGPNHKPLRNNSD